jgi:hypothetical protein
MARSIAETDGGMELLAAHIARTIGHDGTPVDMLLFCPMCATQHIDRPEPDPSDWDNPPHRSHKCRACGHQWRPSDAATNGVTAITTSGNCDGTPVPYSDSAYAGDLASLRRNVDAALDSMGSVAVRVREGGGYEDMAASLAVSVAEAMRKIENLEHLLSTHEALTGASEADAERYRWLRDRHSDRSNTIVVMDDEQTIEDLAGIPTPTVDLDAAIDAIKARDAALAVPDPVQAPAAAESDPFDDIPF